MHSNKKYSENNLILWLTGISGAGKTTIANQIVQRLKLDNLNAYSLDGDILRTGINHDLDFSLASRKENIRRTAEIAKILQDAGFIVICSLISPLSEDRLMAKNIIGDDSFVEIFINTSFEIAESRDVKGLYKKARSGLIINFTGIDSPYEFPAQADIVINTKDTSADDAADYIIKKLEL